MRVPQRSKIHGVAALPDEMKHDLRLTCAARLVYSKAAQFKKTFACENIFTSLQSRKNVSGSNFGVGTNYVNLLQVPAHTIT